MKYSKLTKVYINLEKTTKRLEKTEIISNFIKDIQVKELPEIIYLLQGKVFPQWDERKIGFSSKLVIKAIATVSGKSPNDVEKLWATKGDLGLVSEQLIKSKTQLTIHSNQLTTNKVISNIRKLAEIEGQGTVSKKIGYITELLSNATSLESKYIIKIVLENLRIGIAEGVIKDSIAQAFNKDPAKVTLAINRLVDYGEVAVLAKQNKLNNAQLKPGKPVKLMLAILADNIQQSFKDLKNVQFEEKIDGFRIQIHKSNNKIKLFTRRLEDVTKQFPDIVNLTKKIPGNNYILDAEATSLDKHGKTLPFQAISQRIKRKHEIGMMVKQLPIHLFIFDILYYNKSLIDIKLSRRRELLEKIIPKSKNISLTIKLVTDNENEASKFFQETLKKGHEGLMAKNLDSIYKPGRYVQGWMKLKKVLDPLDLTITKAEFGNGKRAGWLTSFTLACNSKGNFVEIGKASTGLKEKGPGLTYKYLTKVLKKHMLSQSGKIVNLNPKIILEIAYEEIQKSQNYNSGFALRFPKILRERSYDKDISEISTINDVKRIYNYQRGKKS